MALFKISLSITFIEIKILTHIFHPNSLIIEKTAAEVLILTILELNRVLKLTHIFITEQQIHCPFFS